MNSLDVIIILLIIGGAFWGYTRGLLAEIIALTGVLVGILSASRFYLQAAETLVPVLRDQVLTTFIAFIVIYLLSVLLFFLVHLLIKSNMAGGAIIFASRLLATLVGGLRSIVFASMIIFLVTFFWGADNTFTSGSRLIPRFLPYCRTVITLLPKDMQEPLHEYLGGLPGIVTTDGEVVK